MTETRHFGLPLLAAAQAQKHITLNEALARLDGLASGLVESATTVAPPLAPLDGDAYIVPVGAEVAWAAEAGTLCLHLNGNWFRIAPRPGQRVWLRDRAVALENDGTDWYPAGAAPALEGHAALRSITIDHDLGKGNETATIIPDKAVVIGVTGRVIAPLTGTGLTGWALGTPGASARYGRGYGSALGSWAHGVTGAPMAYYGATPLLIEGEGGVIAAGTIRLSVHCHVLTPPAMP